MRVAILGAGNVGGALGMGWARAGHTVVFGSRDPNSAKVTMLLDAVGPNASAASDKEAAEAGEVVVLATPWEAAENIVKGLGDLLHGKPLLDATNPLRADFSGLSVGPDTSAAEQIAGWAANARVVKVFNTVGFNVMADPAFPEGAASMLYCGDDADAKKVAHALAAELGFDPVDAGPLKQARLLEPLAMLWISLAFGGAGRDIAFRLMRRAV